MDERQRDVREKNTDHVIELPPFIFKQLPYGFCGGRFARRCGKGSSGEADRYGLRR